MRNRIYEKFSKNFKKFRMKFNLNSKFCNKIRNDMHSTHNTQTVNKQKRHYTIHSIQIYQIDGYPRNFFVCSQYIICIQQTHTYSLYFAMLCIYTVHLFCYACAIWRDLQSKHSHDKEDIVTIGVVVQRPQPDIVEYTRRKMYTQYNMRV